MSYRPFEWVSRHAGIVLAVALVSVLALGVAGPLVADQSEPNFDPPGEIFEVAERADASLQSDSTIRQATFLVEAADGRDVLTAAALTEWLTASERVMGDSASSAHLVDRYDRDLGTTVPGVVSVANIVDASLANGLSNATTAEVKATLDHVLAPEAPTSQLAFTLSERTTVETGTDGQSVWTSPAFLATVTYDQATFAGAEDTEFWLRQVQEEFRRDATATDSIGVAIDGDLAFSEAATQSSPFIFLAVALIVLLIGVVHRSYWSAVVVATGLGATMLAYNGIASLVGLKMGSLLLAFIVPIAMISFAVDFYIHGTGRVREMQVDEGLVPTRAYPAGMAAVFGAMLLAAASSVGAFLSNAFAGTEAIVEFGFGAAIAITLGYVILGHLAPRGLLALEGFVGRNPVKGASVVLYRAGFVLVAVVAGLAVALAAVMPLIGVGAVIAMMITVVTVPALATRRRNRRAAARGATSEAAVRGAGHGLRPVGGFVHLLARWRLMTIPVVLVVGLLGLFTAATVESGFALTDFLSSDTSFVQSIERTQGHYPSSGQGSGFVLVEGDLTNPEALVALDTAVAQLDGSAADLGRYGDGTLIVAPHAGDLVRMATAADAVVTQLPIALTDLDGDGYPDSAAQIRAVYDYILERGVPAPDGSMAVQADEVGALLADNTATSQATAIAVQIGSFTDEAIIAAARTSLEDAALTVASSAPNLEAGVSGEVLTQHESLESFTDSMLISLPIAVALTLLIAMAMLRSFRYALVSVVPIGFVVVGVYAFMAVAGYTVNVVTATIAAIAVGVGIDFSTHFTARYREELRTHHDRLRAVRRAGEATGGALVLSALTSVLGFLVMALAPTPIFATFGLLTAVMVAMSLVVALVVLPSFLVLVTPRREAMSETQDREVVGAPLPAPARA
jgi:predicted RND superfamily exporter protein